MMKELRDVGTTYQIVFTPAADRAVRTAPASVKPAIHQMVNALRELAAIYPVTSKVWDRLGERYEASFRIEVNDATLLVAIDGELRTVSVLAIDLPERPRLRRGA